MRDAVGEAGLERKKKTGFGHSNLGCLLDNVK